MELYGVKIEKDDNGTWTIYGDDGNVLARRVPKRMAVQYARLKAEKEKGQHGEGTRQPAAEGNRGPMDQGQGPGND